MTARISVLVPSYNYGSRIGACLDSVLAQRHPSLELVVSDDASTDDSDAVIRRRPDSRVVYQRQTTNLGMVPNWRRCVELSSGEYLLLLGADDYLKPGMLEQCAAVLDSDPDVALCHTAVELFTEPGRVVSITGAFQRSYVRPGDELVEGFLRGKRVVSSSSLFRRRCFVELGGWSEEYRNCMDLDLWFRMLLRWKVGYVGKILVGFRSHPVSTDWTVMQAEEDLRFLRSMFARLPPRLAHLQAIEPTLVRDLCTERRATLAALPPAAGRDRVVALLSVYADKHAVAPPSWWSGLRLALRRRAAFYLARLPDQLRYRVGDWSG